MAGQGHVNGSGLEDQSCRRPAPARQTGHLRDRKPTHHRITPNPPSYSQRDTLIAGYSNWAFTKPWAWEGLQRWARPITSSSSDEMSSTASPRLARGPLPERAARHRRVRYHDRDDRRRLRSVCRCDLRDGRRNSSPARSAGQSGYSLALEPRQLAVEATQRSGSLRDRGSDPWRWHVGARHSWLAEPMIRSERYRGCRRMTTRPMRA